ncbi:MAG: hypothetical protein ACI4LB_08220 [Candidatus Fimenecus sp.]
MTVADLGLTYLATPDLKMEGNPLVTEYSLGWGALLTVNVLTLVFYILMAWYAFYRYQPRLSLETESMKRYLSDITYDDPTVGKFGMLRPPKHWAPQIACLCYSVVAALPFARSIIVAEWILLYTDAYAPRFFRIVSYFPLGRIDFFVAVFLAWILSSVWIYREFRENKKQVSFIKSANR